MSLIEDRRDLHRHPELGFTEFRTAARVVERLTSLGYQVRVGREVMDPDQMLGVPPSPHLEAARTRALEEGADPAIVSQMAGGLTGVVGELEGGAPGPVIAVRVDMDALPIAESAGDHHAPVREGFASIHPGVMHACGHDGHTAIGLAVAEAIAGRRFQGRLKLIFQPAEEGGRGARPMVAAGVVDDVDRLLCLHLGLGLELGTVAAGLTGFLASEKLEITLTGRPAHAAAAPQAGRNALLGAATIALAVHALPRFHGCDTRVNVGVLESGTAPNIVPANARLVLEVRAERGDVCDDLRARVEAIVEGTAAAYGLGRQISPLGQTAAFAPDPELVALVAEVAGSSGRFERVLNTHPAGGSEDAGLMIRRVQERGGFGTYIGIGCPTVGPHHSDVFDIDEEALDLGAELVTRLLTRLLPA